MAGEAARQNRNSADPDFVPPLASCRPGFFHRVLPTRRGRTDENCRPRGTSFAWSARRQIAPQNQTALADSREFEVREFPAVEEHRGPTGGQPCGGAPSPIPKARWMVSPILAFLRIPTCCPGTVPRCCYNQQYTIIFLYKFNFVLFNHHK